MKVHIRRPGKDSWVYLGRALVTQEITGQTSRVGKSPRSAVVWQSANARFVAVVRSTTNDKVMTSFHEVR